MWYTVPLVLLATAYGMRRRGQVRAFPFFFLYLIWVAFKSYALLLVAHTYGIQSWPYFYAGHISNGFAIGLTFFVLYEVLSNVLTSGTLKIDGSSFLIVNATLLIAVTLLILMAGHKYHTLAILNSLATIEVSLRYVQISLLVLLAILTRFFGFYWVDLSFGIALGYAFYAAMFIINAETLGKMGDAYTHMNHVVDVLAYYAASCIWLFYAWKKPKSPPMALPSDKVTGYTEPIERVIQ
jgi:hypothetical protein